jgi:hypothetical protein
MSKTLKRAGNIRQWVLVGILLLVLAAFVYDKYILFPEAEEKINKFTEQVTLTLNEKNREQVHELFGFKPASTFTYRGLEVEQYRFRRGLPFIPRPVLDIAYQGNTIAFYRITDPIDNAYIDQQMPATKIDEKLDAQPGPPQAVPGG